MLAAKTVGRVDQLLLLRAKLELAKKRRKYIREPDYPVLQENFFLNLQHFRKTNFLFGLHSSIGHKVQVKVEEKCQA